MAIGDSEDMFAVFASPLTSWSGHFNLPSSSKSPFSLSSQRTHKAQETLLNFRCGFGLTLHHGLLALAVLAAVLFRNCHDSHSINSGPLPLLLCPATAAKMLLRRYAARNFSCWCVFCFNPMATSLYRVRYDDGRGWILCTNHTRQQVTTKLKYSRTMSTPTPRTLASRLQSQSTKHLTTITVLYSNAEVILDGSHSPLQMQVNTNSVSPQILVPLKDGSQLPRP